VRVKKEINRVRQTQAEFGGIAAAKRYCQGLLERQEEAMRRLEQKRKRPLWLTNAYAPNSRVRDGI
jgi:hypothetical protein